MSQEVGTWTGTQAVGWGVCWNSLSGAGNWHYLSETHLCLPFPGCAREMLRTAGHVQSQGQQHRSQHGAGGHPDGPRRETDGSGWGGAGERRRPGTRARSGGHLSWNPKHEKGQPRQALREDPKIQTAGVRDKGVPKLLSSGPSALGTAPAGGRTQTSKRFKESLKERNPDGVPGRVSRQTPQGRHRGPPESMHSLLHNAVPFQGGARQAEGWGESLPAPSECRPTPADPRRRSDGGS